LHKPSWLGSKDTLLAKAGGEWDSNEGHRVWILALDKQIILWQVSQRTTHMT
jgi:hypothetical protein